MVDTFQMSFVNLFLFVHFIILICLKGEKKRKGVVCANLIGDIYIYIYILFSL
jgi:hypothetical protein